MILPHEIAVIVTIKIVKSFLILQIKYVLGYLYGHAYTASRIL